MAGNHEVSVLAEQMNDIADAVCGYREASFEDIMSRIREIKELEKTLLTGLRALEQFTAIREAAGTLLEEIESLGESFCGASSGVEKG